MRSRLLLVSLACFSTALAQGGEGDTLPLGRKVWTQNCIACHTVPDVSLHFDKFWLDMLQTTA